MLKKITLLTATAISAFALHTAELNINDKDLELTANFDIGQFNDNVEPNTMFMGGTFFNPDKSHSSDNLTSINPYFDLNFLVMREIGNNGISLGMGIRLNYMKLNDKSFSSIPLGLEAAYKLPFTDLVPMSISGSVYYAPEVLCLSSDAKSYSVYKIHYDVDLIENAGLTLGYRSMNTKFNASSASINYNSSWYFGFKVKF